MNLNPVKIAQNLCWTIALYTSLWSLAMCQSPPANQLITSHTSSQPQQPLRLEQSLLEAIKLLPKGFQESARNYIASRLKKIRMYPTTKPSAIPKVFRRRDSFQKRMLGAELVTIVPEGRVTPRWVPGELIASQLTRRQLDLINQSEFGPVRSATMVPSVMSTVLVFKKRYDPERLSEVLKYNYGIESEPNGIIHGM